MTLAIAMQPVQVGELTEGYSAAQAFLRRLHEHGIEFLFLNPGTDFPPIVDAYMRAQAIGSPVPRPILVPYEGTAMAMAHGAFLATGRPQAVMVHVSVGTANAINALANASRDQAPILLCAGRSPITEVGRLGSRNRPIHWAQEMFDQGSMVREWVKWDYELRDPAQIIDVVDRAFEVMLASPPGPAYLSLPREPLAAQMEDGISTGRIRPLSKPAASHSDIDTIAEFLASSNAPLIIASGYGRSSGDWDALQAFAEKFAVPVVCPAPRFASFATNHPLHGGFDSHAWIQSRDLIITLDTDAPWIPSLCQPSPDAKIVQIGADPHWVREPIRSFPSDLSIAADSASVLKAVTAHIADLPAAVDARSDEIRRQNAERRALARQLPAADLSPEQISRTIEEVLGDAIIVNEYPLRLDYCDRTASGSYFGLGSAGGLGWGLGAALGIKIAQPDQLVVVTVGDGAFMFMNPSACHWTADVHNLPVLTIVFNNRRYGAVRNATLAMYPTGPASELEGNFLASLESSTRWDQLALAHGGYGERVTSASDLSGALLRARQAVEMGKQALIDIVVDY